MDAIVLAGGYATRLWPITKHRPKMFLPVGDTTVIDGVLEDLETDTRIDDVYVSTNERFADAFEDHLETNDYRKPQLSIEDTTDEDEKFGVIGALAQLVDRENLSDDTIVIAGDNLLSFDVSEFVDFFRQRETPTLAAYDVGDYDRATSYGVLELDDDGREIVAFEEKPDDPPSTLVSVACYGFRAEDLDLLETYLAGENNPDEPGWFVQWLVDRERVDAFTFDGAWYDIGTPESYLDAVAWRFDGDSAIHPDASLEGTTIGPNVHVMEGARVTDATLRNCVVFPDAMIADCTIERAVVDTETEIRATDVESALVGPEMSLEETVSTR
ncbi:NDP-sugar synthase [Haloterrigena salifodinae]|uniref:NDP-sugar synthase n=1 Tax=Haloterrigena salifodinae TaxID=2675099 RepID=A0A8T8E2R0_9EURY|nr:NDP-sugar synthase [Haloterrigena salifodinae]QRV15802.1 NDP-sugar synthase [Haloterrigena salifodinae]